MIEKKNKYIYGVDEVIILKLILKE